MYRVTDNIANNIDAFAKNFKNFAGDNGIILVLFALLIFLIFGKRLRYTTLLRYLTIYLALCSFATFKISNKYLNSLFLLVIVVVVEVFFNTFYKTKPELFNSRVSDEQDDKDEDSSEDSDVVDDLEEEEAGDGVFDERETVGDDDLNAGTIENVTYADANYKYKMSDLDGMVLEKKNEWRIMPKPDSVPLMSKREFIPQGHDVPLKPFISREENLDNVKPPFVDGREGSKRSMVMFDSNAVSLNCCPSTWSTDRGCVCFSDEQRDFVNKRGGNRTYSGDQI